MASEKQFYRRLQVKNVWARTAFEIVSIVFAIVFCSVTIVTAYEKTYSEASAGNVRDSALQIAHSISHLVERDAVQMTDTERRDYVAGVYTRQLESCFIGEDVIYAGAVYVLKDGQPEAYVQTQRYTDVLGEHGLTADDEGGQTLARAVREAFTGIENVMTEGEVCVALVPCTDEEGTIPYAVTAVSVELRDSFEYNSTVRGRITVISLVVGLVIVAYYLGSAYLTERNRIKEKAVNEL